MSCLPACCSIGVVEQRDLPELWPEWEELLRKSYDNRFFSTPAWLSIWLQSFGAEQVHVLTRRDDEGVLQAVLPLQIALHNGDLVLSLLGDPEVMDYMDAVALKGQAPELLADMWEYAFSHFHFDRVELRHVPSGSPLLRALSDAPGQASGWQIEIADDEVCPVAILCSNWDGYLEMLSKKQRHEIRRKLRRAQENAEWAWRTALTREALERDLPVFLYLHRQSAGDKAAFLTPAMQSFFADLAHTFFDLGNLRLSIFSRNGEDIAATMGFVYRNRYLLYNSGYSPAAADVSPGIVAVAHAMQDAIAERIVAFDFLSGDERYKYNFGATDTYTCKATVTRK